MASYTSFTSIAIFSICMYVMLYVTDVSGSPVFDHEQIASRMTHLERCETSSDCGTDECCVSLRKFEIKVCKKRPKLGNLCSPSLMPGLHYSCPCSVGLTCALTAMDNYGIRKKHQCVLVPEEEPERDAREEK